MPTGSLASEQDLKLDDVDRRLIAILQEDGRIDTRTLARMVGISEATARRRIQRLAEERIARVTAVVDVRRAGLALDVLLWLTVEGRTAHDAAEEVAQLSHVLYCHVVTGRYDIFASAAVRDLDELRSLVSEHLRRVAGIRSIDSTLVLDVLAYDYEWGSFRQFAPPPITLDDDLDARIIGVLSEDGRTSNRAIGRALSVSESTVRSRIRRMEGENVLRIVAVANPLRLDRTTFAQIGLSIEGDGIYTVANALTRMEQVTFVAVGLGVYDVVAAVLAKGTDDLAAVLRHISSIPGVRRTETSERLETLKYTFHVAHITNGRTAPGRRA